MRRPWNIVNMPVYSLATYAGDRVNMNICTYVTAVSMKPKLYAIAVYHNTQTLQNLHSHPVAVLQVLGLEQISLLRPLGKKSGLKYDKHAYLQKKEWLTDWQGCQVLKGSCALLKLSVTQRLDVGGDHELFCFKVEKYATYSESGILMFDDLLKAGLIL